MVLIRKARETDIDAIVNDLRISFHNKYCHIFCNNAALGRDVLLRYYRTAGKQYLDQHLIAEIDGKSVGVLGVLYPNQTVPMPSSTTPLTYLIRKAGFRRALKIKMAMKLSESDVYDKDSSYIEFLCVLPRYREHGAGSLLLAEAEKLTKLAELDNISLYVLSDNLKAKELYKNHGYSEVRKTSNVLMQWLLGFREIIYMKKPIDDVMLD